MTARTQQLTDWVSKKLKVTEFLIEPASSDASFRQYFRISFFDDKSFIIMDAPPDKEDSQPFIDVGKLLLGAGLNVPEVLECDLARGFLLLSDLGHRQYLPELTKTSVNTLYGDAFKALHLMRSIRLNDYNLPAYNKDLLSIEMELFREWFLTKHLQISLTKNHHVLLDDVFEFLINSALAQPVICVHRDFHSRNLMVTKANNPGILDFQDAVLGPITYDLVSLLRDCYINWPREQVEAWVKQFHADIELDGDETLQSDQQFLGWFDLMGIQRHLKAIGIFARLNIRDDKPGYLKDIPRTLNYIIDVSQRVDELEELNDFLQKKVLLNITQ